jgi:hypothetical protein
VRSTIPSPLANVITTDDRGSGTTSLVVQEKLRRYRNCGRLLVFRGRRGKLIKVFWHDGACGCSEPVGMAAASWPSFRGPNGCAPSWHPEPPATRACRLNALAPPSKLEGKS